MAAPPSVVAHKPHFHRDEAWKQPVRAATTAAITIATALNAGDVIDGVTLAAGDRVLVKDQAAGAENGLYVAGVTPARAYDMDASSEIVGALVLVVEGTANGGTLWRNTNTGVPTLDTTALAFALATATSALDNLSDVNAPTPTDQDVLTWDDGAGEWIAQAAPGAGGGDSVGQFIAGWDGGGSAPTANSEVDIIAPFTGTITGWTLLADASGSAVVDVWKDSYASYPPTVADTITAAAKPTLSGATKAASTTLTGWTTAVTAGDILRFNLDSASTLTRLLLVLDYTRP